MSSPSWSGEPPGSPGNDVLRLRAVVIIVLVVAAVYWLAPVERKSRWLDKLRELGKALVLTMVIYWAYMLMLHFFGQS